MSSCVNVQERVLFSIAPDITSTTSRPLLFNYATRNSNQPSLFSSYFLNGSYSIIDKQWWARLWLHGSTIKIFQQVDVIEKKKKEKNGWDVQVVAVHYVMVSRWFLSRMLLLLFVRFAMKSSQNRCYITAVDTYRGRGHSRSASQCTHYEKERGKGKGV